jgi:hypothetical protein
VIQVADIKNVNVVFMRGTEEKKIDPVSEVCLGGFLDWQGALSLSLSLSLSFLEHNISHIKEVLNELYSYGSLAAALVLCNHLGIVLMLSMPVTSFMGGAKKLWKSILHDFEPVTSSSV